MKRYLNRNNGFTLIELVIVIAVLAILAGLAIPRLTTYTELARQADDEQIAAIVASAAGMFISSHGEESGFQDDSVTIENLYADELLKKSYGASDLTSIRYSEISLSYSQITGVVVTLTGTIDLGGDFTITK